MSRTFNRHSREDGFTLVELLVVIIIIGILAAIAVPVFLNQRNRAHGADATSNLRNMARSMIDYQIQNGRFPEKNNEAALTNMLKENGLMASTRSGASNFKSYSICIPEDGQTFAIVTADPLVSQGASQMR